METFPPLQKRAKPLIPQEELLASVNAVQKDRGEAPLPGLPALFDAQAHFACVVPALDPYAAFRKQPTLGPIQPLPDPAPPPAEPHVYVYYGMELPNAKPLMEGLAQSGLPATVYLRGASSGLLQNLKRPGLRLPDSPPPFPDILPRCSVAVHYGALGTASACLGAGRPQLLLPHQLERRMTARALYKLEVGFIIPGNFTADHFASCLLKTVNHATLAANASALAGKLERAGPDEVLDRIVEGSLALIDGP